MTTTSLRAIVAAAALLATANCAAGSEAPLPVELEKTISLGLVAGRLDHLAIDLARQRLYVAELGANGVGIVDLKTGSALPPLTGLREPQGLAYVALNDALYVANAGDGTVRMFRGSDLAPLGQVTLGSDADDIRVDDTASRVYVGYGNGALAVIDAKTFTKADDIPLKGHPEGFQLEAGGTRVFVNVPDAHEIAVVDRLLGKEIASWDTGELHGNFPLTTDQAGRVVVGFRRPNRLGVFDAHSGRRAADADACADPDDLFADALRHRIYMSCGDGRIDVLEFGNGAYRRIARVPTTAGARTSLYVPQLDRLFLAVRGTSAMPAAIWVYRLNNGRSH